MAPPLAGAGEPVSAPAAPAPAPEPPQAPLHDRDAKRPRPAAAAGAGARILSLGVQAAVMAAALALFVLFAAAAAVLLLHLVVAARAFRHHHHRSRYRVPSLDPSPRPAAPLRAGLSPAELGRLPTFAFACPRDGDGASEPPHLCAVCLEPARAGERWRALPACVHAFHAACVDRWLAKSPACPVCRAAVAVSVS